MSDSEAGVDHAFLNARHYNSHREGIFCQKTICGGQTAKNYVYKAIKVPGDAPGNIHYGYVGKKAGYDLDTLLFFGDIVQGITNITNFKIPARDSVSDKANIMRGYGVSY